MHQPYACTCARRGIDVHSHVVPSTFPDWTSEPIPVGWPSTQAASCGHRTVVIDGRPYRTVSDACWTVARRIEDMDRAGIEIQALSPMPELFGYWLDAPVADALIRYTNDVIATMVREGGGRFVGLGGVPLQDMDMALQELYRIHTELGFAGVEVGSNVNGAPIGHPKFAEFFAEVARLNMAVFVHAVRPTGMDRLVGPPNLQQVLGYPSDVGLAGASILTGGLLRSLPDLRIALSHGGGTLTALLPRLEQGFRTFPALAESLGTSPSQQACSLYTDTLTFDATMLRRVVEVFGDKRVMIGTDYPFNFRDDDPLGRIHGAFQNADVTKRLIRTNARVFLGLPA
ncbi:amidohydrolase family protein [Falsirhodobacter algicola]|uniref:2-amino-3-carboxymuconate-6-semialdehyde decarboxylase n=1 Tax=Falsirhodobacter algicola TaxID=2692330 RepID=A0A8J8MW51_9RHOB|nr:amidohydrolase family protein [Falsirhodobacter algicola]QUS37431.1 amidohydrolase family protein [Falsirhodobacter algicola]